MQVQLANDFSRWTRVLSRPGPWFWAVILLGAALRFYLAVFTEGTYDVAIWQQHAANVHQAGLIPYYHANEYANHPPFIMTVEALLFGVAKQTGIPFRVLLRLPFAVLDGGVVVLLLALLAAKPWRFAAAAVYWLNPLALIFSAYHGNTDLAVAFLLLLSLLLLSEKKLFLAAVALGASFWFKLPGVLAIPALLLLVGGWRKQLLFLAVAGAVAVSTYVPALIQDAPILLTNVFGYRGQVLQSPGGDPVWGPRVLMSIGGITHLDKNSELEFFLAKSWQIAIGLGVVLAWLRRRQRTPLEVGATIAMAYSIVYALSDTWAFQYFTWSVPFWIFVGSWFFVAATVLAGGYIYSLYAVLCGNLWLRGEWDFVGHEHWPGVVTTFRDLAVIFFFAVGVWFLVSAVIQNIRFEVREVPPVDSTPK